MFINRPGTGLGIEILTTFFLMWGIIGTAAGKRAPSGLGGFGVGLTLGLVILATGPLTGAALNPARHFGTAIASGHLDKIWIYWVGPILGGIIGINLLLKILSPEDKD
jgi:glycerol uptake facilitator-like aquaporin